MTLSNAAIKAARPQDKTYKLHDEKGLYLSVEPTGGRPWRLKYHFDGKEKKLAFGAYPEVGLKDARDKRDEARALFAAGMDPSQKRKADEQAHALQAAWAVLVAGPDALTRTRQKSGRRATPIVN